ncbi:MAG: penicillin-binding protein 2 [Alphaproteobacteria bacterium]
MDHHDLYTRRSFVTAATQTVLASTLVGRMFYLQVWNADHYSTMANSNRIKLEFIPPKRGVIFDRNGKALVESHKNFQALMIPEQVSSIKQVQQVLEPILNVSMESLPKSVRRHPKFLPLTLQENLSWQQVTQIEVQVPDLPGVYIDEGARRHYPYADTLVHVIGYVQTPSKQDTAKDKMLNLPGMKVGKTGIERTFDNALRGTVGFKEIEVNAKRRTVRELKSTPSKTGDNLHLTIDIELQQRVQEILADKKSASAVVLEVPSGNVLALNSIPSYDPNLFLTGISSDNWKALLNNPYNPLLNKALAGTYAPGSVFKIVVALAGLEHRMISPSEKVFCEGHTDLGNHRFHCWSRYGHGSVDLQRALYKSCDIYFYNLAKKLGIKRIADMATRLGLGSKTGIKIPNEHAGLVPTKDWKKQRFGRSWVMGDTFNAGIGQGYLLATPLQMALLMGRIASGQDLKPGILQSESATEWQPLNVKAADLKMIRKFLADAVNHPDGTGYKNRIHDPGFLMAGKSSTTQVRRITMQEREQGLHRQERPWKYRDHGMFTAFAPFDNPQYAVSVVVEHGGWGSKAAAPLARDILIAARDLGV